MTPLGRRIAALIAAQGPISIAQFMTIALHDRTYGYYATRDPLGRDFITAPEISQMFGELIGLWIVQCWIDQGQRSPARLVELGPGRGTLMADMLRAARQVPDFLKAIDVVLIEASPALKAIQQDKLKDAGVPVSWRDSFDGTLDDRALFLVANEFFDALPINQFVMTERGWCERMVTVDQDGALAFALSPVTAALNVPADRGTAAIGAIYEVSPSAFALGEEIGRIVATRGGAALIVDYGFGTGGFGETFQAIGNNQPKALLEAVGDVDLSAHVDFAALAGAARAGGAVACGPVTQGALLTALGIVPRAARLSAVRDVAAERDRLIDAGQMGTLFKALAIVPNGAVVPAGFS